MDTGSRFARIILVLLLGVLFHLQTIASRASKILPSNVEFMLNTQMQSLSWSIAGNANGENPNILSELIWENLSSIGVGLKPEWQIGAHFYTSAHLSFNRVFRGTVTDSDYEGDHRASRVFYSEIPIHDGYSCQFYPNIGYRFRVLTPLEIRLQAGYVLSSQYFYLKDDQVVGNEISLNSTYHTLWQGPGFSLETEYCVLRKTMASIGVHYYQVQYRANANWNLLETVAHPVSFTHRAKGYGLEFAFQLNREINAKVQLIFRISSSHWSTGIGLDNLFKPDGSIIQTRLNNATFQDLSAKLGFRVAF